LNESNLHELEVLKTAESNSVILYCDNATHETIASTLNVLKDFGSALGIKTNYRTQSNICQIH